MENHSSDSPVQQQAPAYSGAALNWLQALPREQDMADPFLLDEDAFAFRCIREILANQRFDLDVKSSTDANRYLLHFYFESRNREKVFGTRNFGLGYPFVFTEQAGYEISAPLFIWQLQVEPHAKQPDQWHILQPEQHFIFPNYPLLHLLDFLYGSKLTEEAQELADRHGINADTLAAFARKVAELLSLQTEGLELSIQPFPEPAETARLMKSGHLRWSALIGIFPTLPKTTITQPPVLTGNLPADLEWRHHFTQLTLDSSQRNALLSAQQNAISVIEGASGTGKTYLASSIIINALSNGKKCLVVSKSLNALRRAQKFLIDKGFGDLSFILRDIHSDHLMLSDMLRMAAENKTKASFDEEMFKSLLNRTLREERKLDEAWLSLHSPVFGDQDFSAMAGAFLQANRQEGKELLLSQLQPGDFAFSREEYDTIVKAIRESEPLFQQFPTLQHPLTHLNGRIFTKHSAEEGLKHTQYLVQDLLDKATGLHHRYITKTNDYSESLTEHYEQHFIELDQLARKIRESIEDGANRFGPDFEKPASVTEKLYGVFSDHYKQILEGKERVSARFSALKKSYAAKKYFDFDFPGNFDARNIKKIAELVKDFEAALRLWRRRIPTVVREDLRRLNSKSIHQELDYHEQIKELEYTMDVFLEEFNAAGLYAAEVRHEMLTIPKRQEFLEDVIARLEETRFYLRDFNDFYVWQRHWLRLEPNQQKVVRALCKIKPRQWVAAFDSWYLFHFLQNEYAPGMQWEENALEEYEDDLRALRNLLPYQISAHWQARKNKALKALKSADNLAFKTWFGKDNRSLSASERVDDLFKDHIHALTETLPVLLVTPQVALDVVNLSNMLFDLVIVDEAHNIPKQECYHLFDMGKNLVVLGDGKQDMTPFAEDDFLEFCKGIGAPVHTLEFQHQDSPEEWLNFTQVAFNTPVKRLPAVRKGRELTVVANVEGRYDEQRRTNESEARQVIDWLNHIEPTPAKTYPVVGIACATVEQRNLIAGLLLQIRQKKMPGHEKIHQLFLNGLGVYQFAELQGQHVEVLLLSLTHGLIDSQGALTRDLHFWNTQLGLNQLYVALTRATQRIFIAHSIPAGLYAVLSADKNFLGTCILSHLASYAEMIHAGDATGATAQLGKMKALLQYKDYVYPASPFTEEVEYALQPYFEQGRIKRNARIAGMNVPFLIRPAEGDSSPPIVLLLDGVLLPSERPSYEWEVKARQYFQKKGIDICTVYSAQWWKNPRQEVRKLAGKALRQAPVETESDAVTGEPEAPPETQAT